MRDMTQRQKELLRQFAATLALARKHGKVDFWKCARAVRERLVPQISIRE